MFLGLAARARFTATDEARGGDRELCNSGPTLKCSATVHRGERAQFRRDVDIRGETEGRRRRRYRVTGGASLHSEILFSSVL